LFYNYWLKINFKNDLKVPFFFWGEQKIIFSEHSRHDTKHSRDNVTFEFRRRYKQFSLTNITTNFFLCGSRTRNYFAFFSLGFSCKTHTIFKELYESLNMLRILHKIYTKRSRDLNATIHGAVMIYLPSLPMTVPCTSREQNTYTSTKTTLRLCCQFRLFFRSCRFVTFMEILCLVF